MLAQISITPWHWAGFIECILLFLALDLGFFHRKAHVVRFKEALCWTAIWFGTAMLFALALVRMTSKDDAVEFVTGYIIELSLSMDNVFVIAMIFTFFRVPSEYQHRVLFWGILGALVMRGLMIWAGVELTSRFGWILYLLGAFLIYSGIKMCFSDNEGVDPDRNPVVRLVRRLYPVSSEYHGQRFLTSEKGRMVLTPLALVLVMVETTDLMFAVDSIPAIFSITDKPFIIFTSNVFAILGLRSLYFLLAGAIELFRYLKYGLSVVLVFVGVKMLIDPHGHEPEWYQFDIPTPMSLGIVLFVIVVSILISVMFSRHKDGGPGDATT